MTWCLNCQDDFRLDDTGGYNPPCKCGAKCRSCCDSDCEHGEDGRRDVDCCDLCGDPWERCRCDGEAVSVNKSTPIVTREASSE